MLDNIRIHFLWLLLVYIFGMYICISGVGNGEKGRMVICLSYLTKITQLTIMKCKNTENKKCFLGLKLSPFIPMRSKFQNPSILKSMH